jgi:hypothetical protein
MRSKLLLMLLLVIFALAACGSNQSQNRTSSQAVTKAATCQSSISIGSSTTSSTSSSQPVAPRHMNMGPHMKMTSFRPVTQTDMARINAIVQNAHVCFDKYRDYHLALQDGYRIFAPNVPQDIYHFVSVQNFSEAQTKFDLAHPSALLYKKVGNSYQFVGVMYSAPAEITEDQLNARIPLSVAPWHLHVNICLPAGDAGQTLFNANSLFGLAGTITTKAQCSKIGGTFYASMYGWMVHIPLFGSVGVGMGTD